MRGKRKAVQNVERCLSLSPLAWTNNETLSVVYDLLKGIGAITKDNNAQILDRKMSRRAVDILCSVSTITGKFKTEVA